MTTMDKPTAIARLEKQRAGVKELLRKPRGAPDFKKWHRDTEVAIGNIFKDDKHVKDFSSISYSLRAFTIGTPDIAFQEAYENGLKRADAVLASLADEIREYWPDEATPEPATAPTAINQVEAVCMRFPLVVRQLRKRYDARAPLEIEDEYDVQDLVRALLALWFDDVRPEEWTPSYAGKSARMDFLIKDHQLVVETKKTRKGLGDKEVGDELMIDIQRYASHPDCKTLVCFVYDPEGRVSNARGIERDLSGQKGMIDVKVIVAPKGT